MVAPVSACRWFSAAYTPGASWGCLLRTPHTSLAYWSPFGLGSVPCNVLAGKGLEGQVILTVVQVRLHVVLTVTELKGFKYTYFDRDESTKR